MTIDSFFTQPKKKRKKQNSSSIADIQDSEGSNPLFSEPQSSLTLEATATTTLGPSLIDEDYHSDSLLALPKQKIVSLLEEVVTHLPLFKTHLGWTRTKILPENPSLSPQELAIQLEIPLGEAFLILKLLTNMDNL